MRKSSLYLPDELKDRLAALSERWGRSEAELIRTAIERLVVSAEAEPAPARNATVAQGPRLIGVGVGPSGPDLITQRALDVLHAAAVVYAPSAGPDVISRAEAVVRAAAPEVRVDRLVIEIGSDAGGRDRSIADGVDELIAHLDRGELVVVAVLGDPNVYSVFSRIAELVGASRGTVPVETVPGVMAFQDLAAQTGTVLVEGDEELTVVTLGADASRLEPLLDDGDRAVVIYKGGRHLPEVARLLKDHDRLEGAVVGEMLGLPGGRGAPVGDVGDRPASYLATTFIPARRPSAATPGDDS